MIKAFEFSSIPKIVFGPGSLSSLPSQVSQFGTNVLIITGQRFLIKTGFLDKITRSLKTNTKSIYIEKIATEPSPQMIDLISGLYHSKNIHVVVAIGGGSVMDAGKAIAAMITCNEPIKTYLEGVGTKKPEGTKVPFIAIPTTAGTGSETTKNAVISEIGENGFKKSLRHDNYIPNIAIIDPELTVKCPPEITAAGGMDALTQLIESYLSSKCDIITESIALPAIEAVNRSLLIAFKNGGNVNARSDMSYAAMISGITLANAGLGAVHGFASPLGGFFNIPHGIVCGTLMAVCNDYTLKKAREINDEKTILKYENITKIFFNKTDKKDIFAEMLIERLYSLTSELKIPKLGEYGITLSDIEKIVNKTGNKNNPVKLNRDDLVNILKERL